MHHSSQTSLNPAKKSRQKTLSGGFTGARQDQLSPVLWKKNEKKRERGEKNPWALKKRSIYLWDLRWQSVQGGEPSLVVRRDEPRTAYIGEWAGEKFSAGIKGEAGANLEQKKKKLKGALWIPRSPALTYQLAYIMSNMPNRWLRRTTSKGIKTKPMGGVRRQLRDLG